MVDDPDLQSPAERIRRALVESTRRESNRDSFSCSVRFLWRQHVEVRLRQMIACCTFLRGGDLEAPAAGPPEQLWPEARRLLNELSSTSAVEMDAAEPYLELLREATSGSPVTDDDHVGFPGPISPLVEFLESTVAELDRESQRKLSRRT